MKKKKVDKVDLNSMFPYEQFTIRVEIPTENKICWFNDNIDAEKYIERHKLDKGKLVINEKPNLL